MASGWNTATAESRVPMDPTTAKAARSRSPLAASTPKKPSAMVMRAAGSIQSAGAHAEAWAFSPKIRVVTRMME